MPSGDSGGAAVWTSTSFVRGLVTGRYVGRRSRDGLISRAVSKKYLLAVQTGGGLKLGGLCGITSHHGWVVNLIAAIEQYLL